MRRLAQVCASATMRGRRGASRCTCFCAPKICTESGTLQAHSAQQHCAHLQQTCWSCTSLRNAVSATHSLSGAAARLRQSLRAALRSNDMRSRASQFATTTGARGCRSTKGPAAHPQEHPLPCQRLRAEAATTSTLVAAGLQRMVSQVLGTDTNTASQVMAATPRL